MFANLKLLVPLMCLSACVDVTSQSVHSLAPAATAPAAPSTTMSTMPKGPAVAAPQQFQEYCARTPEDCAIPHSAEVAAAIAESQHMAHQMVSPAAEEKDVWTSLNEGGAGDCEDFALTVRKALRTRFPGFASAFRIATAYTEQNQYHAVLTIETDGGTIVCDIRFEECAPWQNFPYQWRLREVAGSNKWQELGPYRMTAEELAAAAAGHEALMAMQKTTASSASTGVARTTAPTDEPAGELPEASNLY